MYKSLAVMALVLGTSAVDLKFAVGQGEDEWNGETIQMKGPSKMESYSHVMTHESRLGGHERKKYNKFLMAHDHPNSKAAKADLKKKKKGTKKHNFAQAPVGKLNKADEDFAEGLTPEEHDFKTTIRMKEAEGLRPYHYSQKASQDEFAEGLTDAEHDFKTTIRMKEPEGLRPYHYAQKHQQDEFAEGLTDAEHDFKTTIRMKEPEGLRPYHYAQKDEEDEFAEGLTDAEHDFKTTIRMKEPEGLRPYHYAQKHQQDEFAEGLTDAEHDFKTTIRMKEPEGLRPYHYAQKDEEDEFAEGLTDAEHDFKTTIRMKEPEGLRPYHYAQKDEEDEFAEGLTEPEHDFKTTIRMKEPEGLRPYHYLALNEEEKKDAAAGGAKLARPAVPIRGEKQWQDWAQNLIDHEDFLTMKANTRIPYFSTVQMEENNLVHISNEEGDELVKMEDSSTIPLSFRF